jgi:hypothetical protein
MATIRNLKVSTLQKLATKLLQEMPGLTSKELYGRLCQTPTVIAFREKKFPEYKPPAASEVALTESLTVSSKNSEKKRKEKKATDSTQVIPIPTATVAPTRT